MLRLLKLTIALTVILSTLIVLARVAAPPDVYAFPLNSINLTADCQLPCWHGITPGVTTRAEALAIFDADPAYLIIETDNVSSLDVRYLDPSSNSDAYLSFDENGIVKWIKLTGFDSMYHMVAKLGTPIGTVESMCDSPWDGLFAVQVKPNSSLSNMILSGEISFDHRNYNATDPIRVNFLMVSISHIDSSYLGAYPLTVWRGFRLHYLSIHESANCD